MHSQDELYKNLFKALKNLDYDEAQSLISQGANINHKSQQGRSLICVPAEKNDVAMAEWLVQKGLNTFYDNLIYDTIKYKSNDFLSWVLNKGISLNQFSEQNLTPLMFAALNNNYQAVSLLVSHGADVNSQNQYGTTALLIAVDKAPVEMTEFLIKSGASPKLSNMDGDTPLIICFKYGRVEHALLLLKHSDSKLLNKKNNYGSSAISFLVREEGYYSPDLLNAVIQRDETYRDVDFNVNVYGQRFSSPALMLIKSGNVEAFRCIMNNSTVDLNVEDLNGNDIMHYISLYRYLNASLLSDIIKKGYNSKNVKSKDGLIPYYGIMNSSLEHNEKVDIVRTIKAIDFRNAYVDFNPNVLAYDCMKNRDVELLTILVNEGVVDIASVDNEGNNFIHHLSVMMTVEENIAVRYFQDLIIILKQSLAESNQNDFTEDEWQEDVLLIQHHQDEIDKIMNEISYAFDHFIMLCQDKNIDVNKKNIEGETPLMKLICNGTDVLIEKIMSYAPDLLSENEYGENALVYAIKYNRINCFYMLAGQLENKSETLNKLLIDLLYNMPEDDRYKLSLLVNLKSIINKYSEVKSSIHHKDEDGNSAIIIAAALGEYDMVKLLIEEGAKVNDKNKLGETALMHAVLNKSKEIILLLMSNEADANIKNNQGQNSFDLADETMKEIMLTF